MKSHQEDETQMLQRMLTTKMMEITKKSSSKEGINSSNKTNERWGVYQCSVVLDFSIQFQFKT